MMYRRQSFSLIELLITLALVITVVVFTIPRTNFFTRFLLQSEISKMHAVFSYLQQRAIASNEKQVLFIDLNAHLYKFKTIQGVERVHGLPDAIRFGYLSDVMGPPSSPTKVIDRAATFPCDQGTVAVEFLTNGNICPGTVYFVNKGKKSLGALTCSVSQVSYVRRYSYNGRQWNVW